MRTLEFCVRLAAAALLVGGIRKFPEPEATCKALKLAGLPSHRPWVWGLASVEIVVGLVTIRNVIVLTAGATAVVYVFLTAFLLRARKVGIGCGCFGPGEHPPSLVHLGLNSAAIVVCAAAALTL
jgi:hypothetical protein